MLVVVTADHSTPGISRMIHSGEPVPVIMAGQCVREDDVRSFSETQAACGCLGMLYGASQHFHQHSKSGPGVFF